MRDGSLSLLTASEDPKPSLLYALAVAKACWGHSGQLAGLVTCQATVSLGCLLLAKKSLCWGQLCPPGQPALSPWQLRTNPRASKVAQTPAKAR